MTLILAILVLVFTLFCAVKAITAQRANHASYLADADARREAFAADYAALVAMVEQDKQNGIL